MCVIISNLFVYIHSDNRYTVFNTGSYLKKFGMPVYGFPQRSLFVHQKYYTDEKKEQEQKRIAWGIRNPQLRK